MHVRIFPPLVFIHYSFPIFVAIDLVFTFCLLPVWHLVGASGEGMMASPCDPIPSIPSPLRCPIPLISSDILRDFHCKSFFSLPHSDPELHLLPLFIHPASKRTEVNSRHCRTFPPPSSFIQARASSRGSLPVPQASGSYLSFVFSSFLPIDRYQRSIPPSHRGKHLHQRANDRNHRRRTPSLQFCRQFRC